MVIEDGPRGKTLGAIFLNYGLMKNKNKIVIDKINKICKYSYSSCEDEKVSYSLDC